MHCYCSSQSETSQPLTSFSDGFQVHSFTDVCWDKCVDSPGSKLDSRTETRCRMPGGHLRLYRGSCGWGSRLGERADL
uniref:Mitochondrial import inner membrane translocase subunit n=1 Tax=Acanthochromis polyacanthus TaxID=80966 RepID=A0A3Q1EYE6_9TELE